MSDTQRNTMSETWDFLVETTKHRSRYFFHEVANNCNGISKTPKDVLKLLHQLTSLEGEWDRRISIGPDNDLFRARICDASWNPSKERELWAPPTDKVSAGRMNPAGISYLYLATERETALAEINALPPCEVAIGHFNPKKELILLDLEVPPNLEKCSEKLRSAFEFFRYFIDSITLPVVKDGREHVEYVPSQIVCEYFAHAHNIEGATQLHGLQYPSTVRDGGKNIVLFPTASAEYGVFSELLDRSGDLEVVNIDSWKSLVRETTPPTE